MFLLGHFSLTTEFECFFYCLHIFLPLCLKPLKNWPIKTLQIYGKLDENLLRKNVV